MDDDALDASGSPFQNNQGFNVKIRDVPAYVQEQNAEANQQNVMANKIYPVRALDSKMAEC